MRVLTSCGGSHWAGFMICHRNVLVWGGGRLINRADKLCREGGWMDPRDFLEMAREQTTEIIEEQGLVQLRERMLRDLKKVDATWSEEIR